MTTIVNPVLSRETDRLAPAGLVAGIAFAAISVAAGAVAPVAPAANATADKVRAWVGEHQTGLNVGTLLVLLGPLVLLVFFAALRGCFHDHGVRDVFFAFGVLTVAVAFVGAVFEAVLVHGGARLGDDSALLALFRMWRTMFYAAPAITSTGYLLAASAGIRSSTLPRWLGPAGIAVGLIGLASGVITATTTTGGLPAFGLVGFLLNVAWVVVASLSFRRTPTSR